MDRMISDLMNVSSDLRTLWLLEAKAIRMPDLLRS